jgi:hypothetical protein
LKELSLRGCVQLTDRALDNLGPNLEEINLGGCKRITLQGVVSLAQRCPLLRRVNLHGLTVTDQSIDALSRNCPQLETLHASSANPFGGSSPLTDQSLAYLSRCPNLVCLNLQGSSNLTDYGVRMLLRHCNKLDRLNLGGCFRLTDASVIDIGECAPRMIHLSLFQCFQLTDHSLLSLTSKLPNLVHIDVHGCAGLSRTFIDALIQNALDVPDTSFGPLDSPVLSATSISDTSAIMPLDDAVIPSASDGRSSSLSSEGQPSLLWPNLQSLDIASCRNIPATVVAQLHDLRPSLNIIHY